MKHFLIKLALLASLFSLSASSAVLAVDHSDWGQTPGPKEYWGSTIDGPAVDRATLPEKVIVGQRGQVRRPQNDSYYPLIHSLTFRYSNKDLISINEAGEWVALKPGRAEIMIINTEVKDSPALQAEMAQYGFTEFIPKGYLPLVFGFTRWDVTVVAPSQTMHRLYNPNSGEHFYTAATGERDYLIKLGWRYEGKAWDAPTVGDSVYRLYNPNAGDHHYTTSAGERDYLVKVGWRYEGEGWKSAGTVPVYRLYNPNAKKAGAHHYTTSSGERDYLVSIGWRDEGIGWYAQ